MKTRTFLITTLLVLSLMFTAQTQSYQVGVIGGVNFADLSLKSASGSDQLTSSKTRFGFGAVVGRQINQYLKLQLEPMYLQKGATQMATQNSANTEVNLSVLEIPLFIKASYGNSIKPYFKAGPTLGILLSAEGKTEYGGVTAGQPLTTYEADLTSVLNSLDFGVSFGAGLDFTFKKYNVFIEGRYSLGLADLYKGGTIEWKSTDETIIVQGNEAAELKTSGIQVFAGITFPFGK
jgi:hypothetical protein